MKLKQVLLGLCSTLLLLTPIYFALSCPPFVEVSDFGTTFYTAATLLKENRTCDLYPTITSDILYHSSFTNYSHQILNSLPANQTTLFQYPPLIAYLLQPLSHLPLQNAFLCWQFFSILALFLSVFLLASLTRLNWLVCFALSILYFPVLHTLLTGQIGLILICV